MLRPPPPLYLYIVKIENFTRDLMPFLTYQTKDAGFWYPAQCKRPACSGLHQQGSRQL